MRHCRENADGRKSITADDAARCPLSALPSRASGIHLACHFQRPESVSVRPALTMSVRDVAPHLRYKNYLPNAFDGAVNTMLAQTNRPPLPHRTYRRLNCQDSSANAEPFRTVRSTRDSIHQRPRVIHRTDVSLTTKSSFVRPLPLASSSIHEHRFD